VLHCAQKQKALLVQCKACVVVAMRALADDWKRWS